MNAQTAAKPASSPQTPSLPHAKPETIGLSPSRLQKLSDAFKREVDKGTLPGATVGQWPTTPSSASSP
jgi:CubicO group peptidase (beta-lactamase class C family)